MGVSGSRTEPETLRQRLQANLQRNREQAHLFQQPQPPPQEIIPAEGEVLSVPQFRSLASFKHVTVLNFFLKFIGDGVGVELAGKLPLMLGLKALRLDCIFDQYSHSPIIACLFMSSGRASSCRSHRAVATLCQSKSHACSRALHSLVSLCSLCVGCELSDVSVIPIADTLPALKHLTVLNFANNHMTEKSLRVLAEKLPMCKNLIGLALLGNKPIGESVILFGSVIQFCVSLETFYGHMILDTKQYSATRLPTHKQAEIKDTIARAVASHPTLQTIRIFSDNQNEYDMFVEHCKALPSNVGMYTKRAVRGAFHSPIFYFSLSLRIHVLSIRIASFRTLAFFFSFSSCSRSVRTQCSSSNGRHHRAILSSGEYAAI
eukprot:m.328260 g.328260  ORF g.328260 m.328260 type:complete len:376 (+) comp55590_c0_seq19:65-1192(+)